MCVFWVRSAVIFTFLWVLLPAQTLYRCSYNPVSSAASVAHLLKTPLLIRPEVLA